ncbi:hypothetical protein BGX27_004972, partial [Mortierella sp. AM989]
MHTSWMKLPNNQMGETNIKKENLINVVTAKDIVDNLQEEQEQTRDYDAEVQDQYDYSDEYP